MASELRVFDVIAIAEGSKVAHVNARTAQFAD